MGCGGGFGISFCFDMYLVEYGKDHVLASFSGHLCHENHEIMVS